MRCRRAAIPQLAAGFALSVASTSKNKEAAYLFIQWLNSEEISNKRVQLPYALRDPFRDSHFTNPGYLKLWPDAKDYLAALGQGAQDRPARPFADPDRQVRRGAAPGHQPAVGGRGSEEDSRRRRQAVGCDHQAVGVDKQKAVYAAWAAKSGAYPK